MTTTPINLHTCDVSDLYAACLDLPTEEGLCLSDLLEERFGYGKGWKWMVKWKRMPVYIGTEDAEIYAWACHASVLLELQQYYLPIERDAMKGEKYLSSFSDYPTLSEALLDCARAAS